MITCTATHVYGMMQCAARSNLPVLKMLHILLNLAERIRKSTPSFKMAFVTPVTTLRHPSHPLPHVARGTVRPIRAVPSQRASICMGPVRSTETDTPKKVFMDRLKALKNTRLIVRNEAGIMEAIAPFDGLFFASIRSNEYANLIDLANNLDLHLMLSAVSGACFEVGVSRSASKAPTYIIRILGSDRDTAVLTIFMQWDKVPEDIAPERIEAWKKLKADYVSGDEDTFFFEE